MDVVKMDVDVGVVMASIIYRRKKQQVYVYVWDRKKGGQIQVPRKLTKHLDGRPPVEVEQWVAEWEAQHGPEIAKTSRRVPFQKDESLKALYAAYRAHRASVDNVNPFTLDVEEKTFDRYMLPYFIGQAELKDPKTWHTASHGLLPWMLEKGYGEPTIRKAVGVLLRFGEYLVYSKYMPFPYVVKVPKAKVAKITPLKARIVPDDVLKKSLTLGPDLELASLLAYFGALEPSVLWALEIDDFITGDLAKAESKTYLGFQQAGLGSGLAVLCRRSVDCNNRVRPFLKNEYRYAVVNIWHVGAAKRIAALLKGREGRLFKYSRPHMERLWLDNVKPVLGGTPHDMRRSSCLYLGRTLRIQPTLLQEHMRHSQLDTTMLYCRDPRLPEIPKDAKRDLDDVV